jgi:C-terminal processing protease CtpA/Prc
MIVEGKHAEAGSGVFVSDLQPGSCAQQAGLQRGDMILCVNGEDFIGVNYETAAKVLKNSEGTIRWEEAINDELMINNLLGID